MHQLVNKVILLVVLLNLHSAVDAQSEADSSGIWFRRTEHFTGRFAYSQAILWPTSIAGHIGLYFLKDDFDWSQAVRWSMYKRSFSQLPQLDHDHWSWNYEVHPIMGSFSYLSYRNHGASILESVAGSALNSAIYEYIIAGGTQPPSWNDMLVTPIAGSLLGESIFQLRKLFMRDHYLNTIEKIIISITDPFETIYYGFNYHKILLNHQPH